MLRGPLGPPSTPARTDPSAWRVILHCGERMPCERVRDEHRPWRSRQRSRSRVSECVACGSKLHYEHNNLHSVCRSQPARGRVPAPATARNEERRPGASTHHGWPPGPNAFRTPTRAFRGPRDSRSCAEICAPRSISSRAARRIASSSGGSAAACALGLGRLALAPVLGRWAVAAARTCACASFSCSFRLIVERPGPTSAMLRATKSTFSAGSVLCAGVLFARSPANIFSFCSLMMSAIFAIVDALATSDRRASSSSC